MVKILLVNSFSMGSIFSLLYDVRVDFTILATFDLFNPLISTHLFSGHALSTAFGRDLIAISCVPSNNQYPFWG